MLVGVGFCYTHTHVWEVGGSRAGDTHLSLQERFDDCQPDVSDWHLTHRYIDIGKLAKAIPIQRFFAVVMCVCMHACIEDRHVYIFVLCFLLSLVHIIRLDA